MNKEVKIGLAVILSLLVVLGGVLLRRFTGPGAAPTAAIPAASESDEPLVTEAGLEPAPSEPTVLEAQPEATPAPTGDWSSSSARSTSFSEDDHAETGPEPNYLPKNAADGDPYPENYPSAPETSSDQLPEQRLRVPTDGYSQEGQPAEPPSELPQEDASLNPLSNQTAPDLQPTFTPDEQAPAAAEGAEPQSNWNSEQTDLNNSSPAEPQLTQPAPYSAPADVQPATEPAAAAPAASPYERENAPTPQQEPYGRSEQYSDTIPDDAQQTDQFNSSSYETDADDEPVRENTGTYHVEPNDNFWTISQKIYGTGGYFKALQQHNRGRFPRSDKLNVGDEIATPPVSQLHQKYSGLCPKQRTAKPGTQAISVSARTAGGKSYVVEEGDTLYDIAKYELGDAKRWPEIYALNRRALGDDIDFVRPGTRLVLPVVDEGEDQLTREPGDAVQR